MKILIVDDNAETKCYGIMEECKKRNIEVEIETSISSAVKKIVSNKGYKINGIILDMGLPIYSNSNEIEKNGGEEVIRQIVRRNNNIPVLVFSETELRSNYYAVFNQIKDWNIVEEQMKFIEFIEYLKRKSEKTTNL